VRPLEGRNSAHVFDEHRDLLVSVAYRVLGSVTDAEDTVQEAWLRWCKVDPAEVSNPRAFLVRVTTRLAIDRLRRTKARRESYVGPWLPEPILTRWDVAEDAAMVESVSMAMLVVLETLSPLERAVAMRVYPLDNTSSTSEAPLISRARNLDNLQGARGGASVAQAVEGQAALLAGPSPS